MLKNPQGYLQSPSKAHTKTALTALLLTCAISAHINASTESKRPLAGEICSFADIVEKVAPAVVNIQVFYERVYVHPFLSDPFFRSLFEGMGGLKEGVPGGGKVQELAVGSGAIVKESGIVLSCAHVVQNAQKIVVRLKDGRVFKAKILFINENEDIAFLQLEAIKQGETLPIVTLGDSTKVRDGEAVLALGYPEGSALVTNGIVSSKNAPLNGRSFIKTTADLGPGNSGGVLVNMNGEVIGIPNAILAKFQTLTKHGFAIPISIVEKHMRHMGKGGVIHQPWHGITTQTILSRLQEGGFPDLLEQNTLGTLVVDVDEKSPAYKAGLRKGDHITAVNQLSVKNHSEFNTKLDSIGVGETVDLAIVRQGVQNQVSYTAIEAPHTPQNPVSKTISGTTLTQGLLKGLSVLDLPPDLAKNYQLPENAKGVIVTNLEVSSPLLSLGVQKGDILKSVNGKTIQSVSDITSMNFESEHSISLFVDRRGAQIQMSLSTN